MTDDVKNDADLDENVSDELLPLSEDESISSTELPEVEIQTNKKSFLAKYSSTLKTLIPLRLSSRSEDTHPCDAAGLLSTITFSWLTTLIWKTYKKPPTIDELWKMSEHDSTQRNYERLSRLWEEELRLKGPEDASLWKVVLRFVRTRLIVSTVVLLIYALALFFVSSVVVHSLLSYISEENHSVKVGACLIVSLFCVDLIRSSTGALHLAINYRTAVRCRAAVLLLVFKKALDMSSSGGSNIGELVTMCSNDGDRIFEVNHFGNMICLGPVMFISGLIYTCYLFGPIGLVGPILFISTIPLQGVLVKVLGKVRKKMIASTQARTVKINEILSSIKFIKMYSWEQSFSDVVNKLRERELSKIKVYNFLYNLIFSIAYLAPLIASGFMISVYVMLGNNLTADTAFTAIAIFNAMSTGLKFSPVAIKYIADANVSMKRLKKFLVSECAVEYIEMKTSGQENAIEIENASFIWNQRKQLHKDSELNNEAQPLYKHEVEALIEADEVDFKQQSPVLKDINVSIKQGLLVAIVGPVGSGKSSFISGIMGQLQRLEGTVAVSGSVAYVAQQAWLMNATIRENIVFGLKFDKPKYDDVLSACELTKDLEIFSSGDLTEVGERGINLSGGQKQRISLARALYSDRDIYLLDDPLSAVDTHVGKSIFFEVIISSLKKNGKTVLLVTHQLQYLPHCDLIFKVENCTVTIDSPDAVNISELRAPPSDPNVDDQVKSSDVETAMKSDKLKGDEEMTEKGKLMTTEERGEAVGLPTYLTYIKASGGLFTRICVALLFFLNSGVQQFTYFWLSYWLQQGSGISSNASEIFENSSLLMNSTNAPVPLSDDIISNSNFHFYLAVYISSIIAVFLVSIIRGYIYVSMTVRASRNFHQNLLHRVLHGTMEFFETTPTGRILNRFQKDMDELDLLLPGVMEHVILHIIIVFLTIGLIVYIFPRFAYALFVVIPVFIVIYVLFKPASREMMRLDTLTRSPWFSHITATVSGRDTIRAYKKTDDFVKKFCFLLDRNGEAFYLFKSVNRWLGVRLDYLTMGITIVTTVLVVLDRNFVSPAFAALALTQAMMLASLLQLSVRILTELEARSVCTDRINYYIKHTEQETSSSSVELSSEWPENGVVEFRNVSMRYRGGLPLAIDNLSFVSNAHEKIGVVGRTGAGKSSLAVALFRLAELSQGQILIDGVDITSLSFHDLRSRLSIIPQDPVLFSGSVRYNLDPFGQYSESDVWFALEQAHMKEAIANLPDKLEHVVAENGNNFSVGERQLICLARALLRKSKVLILDEATAAVDRATEEIVQEVIQSVFSNCTLITIAHRLSTVLTSDRVLLLGKGKLVEFDSPSNLTENENSAFSSMLSSA